MTWLGDKTQLPEAEVTKLKAKREKLVEKLHEMQKLTGSHRSNAATNGHVEDMTKIAKDINSIDRKLGRV